METRNDVVRRLLADGRVDDEEHALRLFRQMQKKIPCLRAMEVTSDGKGTGVRAFYAAGTSEAASGAFAVSASASPRLRWKVATQHYERIMWERRHYPGGVLPTFTHYVLDRALPDIAFAPNPADARRLLGGLDTEGLNEVAVPKEYESRVEKLHESMDRLRLWSGPYRESAFSIPRFRNDTAWMCEDRHGIALVAGLKAVIHAPEGVGDDEWLQAIGDDELRRIATILRSSFHAVLSDKGAAAADLVDMVRKSSVPDPDRGDSVERLPANLTAFVGQRLGRLVAPDVPTEESVTRAIRLRFRWCDLHGGLFIRTDPSARFCPLCPLKLSRRVREFVVEGGYERWRGRFAAAHPAAAEERGRPARGIHFDIYCPLCSAPADLKCRPAGRDDAEQSGSLRFVMVLCSDPECGVSIHPFADRIEDGRMEDVPYASGRAMEQAVMEAWGAESSPRHKETVE